MQISSVQYNTIRNIILQYSGIQDTHRAYRGKELGNEAEIAGSAETDNLKKGPVHINDIAQSRALRIFGKVQIYRLKKGPAHIEDIIQSRTGRYFDITV